MSANGDEQAWECRETGSNHRREVLLLEEDSPEPFPCMHRSLAPGQFLLPPGLCPRLLVPMKQVENQGRGEQASGNSGSVATNAPAPPEHAWEHRAASTPACTLQVCPWHFLQANKMQNIKQLKQEDKEVCSSHGAIALTQHLAAGFLKNQRPEGDPRKVRPEEGHVICTMQKLVYIPPKRTAGPMKIPPADIRASRIKE